MDRSYFLTVQCKWSYGCPMCHNGLAKFDLFPGCKHAPTPRTRALDWKISVELLKSYRFTWVDPTIHKWSWLSHCNSRLANPINAAKRRKSHCGNGFRRAMSLASPQIQSRSVDTELDRVSRASWSCMGTVVLAHGYYQGLSTVCIQSTRLIFHTNLDIVQRAAE